MSKLEVIDLPAQKEILVKFTKTQKILKYNSWNNNIYILLKPHIPFLKNTKGLFLSIIAIRSIIFASLFITVSCSIPKKPVIIQNQSSKIAFQSDRDGNLEIYTMNADGTGQTRITHHSAQDSGPAWSPIGDKIAFESDRDGNQEIYVMNVDGTGVIRLTNNPGSDSAPRWMTDGKSIVYFSSNKVRNAFIMNADGSQKRTLSPDFVGISPCPSPDGKMVAMEHQSGPTWTEETEYLHRAQIWIMNLNGSSPIQITDIDAYNGYPAWSPDGKQLLFDSNQQPGQPPANIHVINIDGSGLENLTRSTGYNEFAAWSYDGQKIAFVSSRDGNNEIYVMNADGTQQMRLTTHHGDDAIPSWSPFLK